MLEWWQVLGGPKIGISLQRYRGVIVAFDFPSFSSLLIPEPGIGRCRIIIETH